MTVSPRQVVLQRFEAGGIGPRTLQLGRVAGGEPRIHESWSRVPRLGLRFPRECPAASSPAENRGRGAHFFTIWAMSGNPDQPCGMLQAAQPATPGLRVTGRQIYSCNRPRPHGDYPSQTLQPTRLHELYRAHRQGRRRGVPAARRRPRACDILVEQRAESRLSARRAAPELTGLPSSAADRPSSPSTRPEEGKAGPDKAGRLCGTLQG